MECTLAALLTCLSWSGVFIDGGIAWQDRGATEMRYHYTGSPSAAQLARIRRTYDEPDNPYGTIGLGYEIQFRRVTLSLAAYHRSSAADGDDKGINSVELSGRWYPFHR